MTGEAARNGGRRAIAELVAEAHAGAWRDPAPPLAMSAEEFARVAGTLLGTGAGSIGWARLRESPALREHPTAAEFRAAYRLHAIQSALHDRALALSVARLRTAGVEPLLVKGWAVARLYRAPELRPYGDLDLVVRRAEFDAAAGALANFDEPHTDMDLHRGVGMMIDASEEELFARSRLVRNPGAGMEGAGIDGVDVRIPCDEDHLRVLVLHWLRHGGWRPLWLVDIAVALESVPDGFDWELFAGRSATRRGWIACVFELARELVGADLGRVPAALRRDGVPGWFRAAVLRDWEWGTGASRRTPLSKVLAKRRLSRAETALEIRRWWDRPIEASVTVEAPFNAMPRLPFQVAAAAVRAPRNALKFARALRDA